MRLPAGLRFADDRLLLEQLRLIYSNMAVTVLPTFPAIFLLYWTIVNDSNRHALLWWAAGVLATSAYSMFNARRRLVQVLVASDAPKLAVELFVSIAVGGLSWGALAFGVLGNTTVIGNTIVISVLAGVAGGAVALLSPVFLVFAAFVVPLVGLTVSKLFALDDPAYAAFGLITLIYSGVLLMQSYVGGLAISAAIKLSFENLLLLRQTEVSQKNAELANTAKSKFLAAASHDLRQPVHAQGLFLEVLSRTDLSVHQARVLASARLASQASSDMLNTLLDFSRIEAGVVQPMAAPFKLQTLLHKIENDLAPLANAKGLVYRTRETSVMIDSDASLVEMVLRNLVSNAIRYTDQGGVLVACRQRQGVALVEVWDTGIGISVENQLEIFREFHQLGNPERDRRKGLGLGLAIAQGLCKTLGHDLSLQSKPMRGSVFRIALPIALAAPFAAPSPPVEAANGALQARPDWMRGVHVLVIDDDDAVLAGMSDLLQLWGCSVDMANTIEQALVLVARQSPDVLISDYRLRSERTGAQAIAEIRDLLGVQVPALIITGDTAPERLREALSSGVSLLHKPVAPDQLHKVMLELLVDRTRAPA